MKISIKTTLITLTIISIINCLLLACICGQMQTNNDYINMNDITECETTSDGFYIYTEDGNGYYWEL